MRGPQPATVLQGKLKLDGLIDLQTLNEHLTFR